MRQLKQIMVFGVVACLGMMFVSCDSEQGASYDLTVGWNISKQKICRTLLESGRYAQEELVFDNVVINLYEDEEMTEAVQDEVVVPCESYEYTFTRLERGRYYVDVKGIADYDGESLAFFSGEEMISFPAEGDRLDVTLAVSDGSVEVSWKFADGLICGIDTVGEVAEVSVNFNGTEVVVPCGDGKVVFDHIRPGSDYELSAVALDERGDALYDAKLVGDGPVEVLPGEIFMATMEFK